MNWPLSDHTLTSLSLWTICLWCNSAPALPFPPAASPLKRVTSVWVSSHSLAFIYQRIQTDNIHHIVTYCSIDSLYLYCTVRRKYIQYWWISVTFVPGCFWCCHYETKNITMQVKQSAAYMCVCVGECGCLGRPIYEGSRPGIQHCWTLHCWIISLLPS